MRGKGRRGVAIRGGEAGRGSGVGKGPSEAPAIDQKFMSAAGIRPACPLLAFMPERQGGEEEVEWGRTSEIDTLSAPCPHGPGPAYSTGPSGATKGHPGPALSQRTDRCVIKAPR